MKKKLLIFLVFFITVAFLLYNYIYKSHRDISSEKESFAISVSNLKIDYSENDSLANNKYLDKVIVIYGKVTDVDLSSKSIVVDESLSATIKNQLPSLKNGDSIRLKGRFIGYDDLLEEFKMDECAIE